MLHPVDSKKLMISGGAIGADELWGIESVKHGYTPLHYGFEGHRHAKHLSVISLSREQLSLADKPLRLANKSLGRRWPVFRQETANLLMRNWWQVRKTSAVYAISHFDGDGQVAGGTAWAVQMYIDMQLPGAATRCYVYDQERGTWFQYIKEQVTGGWVEINQPPTPPDIFTGIGTRKINAMGRAAIQGVF